MSSISLNHWGTDLAGLPGKQQIRYCGRENPWLEDNQAGLWSNQRLFSPLDPTEAQVISVWLLRTKDTAIGV